MPDQEAIQRGYDFEGYVSALLGASKQPGSGNKFWAKNDLLGNGLSISCKSQKKFSWGEIKSYLNQSIEDANGTGNIPCLAVQDNGINEQYIVMRLSDLVRAFKDEIKISNSVQSKGITKREEADIPLMLR